MVLNAGAADGLATCSATQVGFTGADEATQVNNHEFSSAEAACPDAAKVGTVRVTTPLLPNKLEGSVYLGQQNTNPFQPPLVLYLIARDPVSGVLVKLAGHVTPDPSNGQLVSVFEGTPPLPFEDLEVSFFGGPRASVSTPSACGTYTTTSSISPWSGNAPATPSANFGISSDPAVPAAPARCRSAPAWSLDRKASNPAPTPRSRPTSRVQTASRRSTPLRCAYRRASQRCCRPVTLCPEPQASQGTCGDDSLIGHATATAGLGSQPFTEDGGRVYITGPLRRRAVRAVRRDPHRSGPVQLRQRRHALLADRVDPNTAAVTINSALPTMINTTSTRPACPCSSSRST